MNNYDLLNYTLDPKNGEIRLRFPCPKCGLTEKHILNTKIENIKKLLFSLKDRITDEMIENSKKYVNGISLMENETVDQINDLISIKEVNGIETTLEEDAEEVNKVTKQDIFNAIDKYVKEENICFFKLTK